MLAGMVVELGVAAAVAAVCVFWAAASAVVGRRAAGRPWRSLVRLGRPVGQRSRRRWERLGVRRWKDRLPEAGPLFGGLTKRRLPSATDGGAERFAAECRRAELVHIALLWAAVIPAVWCPPWLWAASLGYAIVANVPCLGAARYNRARAEAIMRTRTRRARPGAS
jgi:glycosyl-4,4'-diaponeurosporenoate acyltransferase